MDITSTVNGSRMELKLFGKMDVISVPDFEEETRVLPEGVTELVLDMAEVQYISSAGLRALLALLQRLQGAMYVRNVPQIVQEIFEVTGFNLLFKKI